MVKGKPEPITAFAAYDVGGSTWPARGVEDLTVIGRERELSILSDGLAKARAGIGGVVVIEGDAGIGKTTLVNRTIAEASNTGMFVLAGAGDSTDQTTAYLAWRRIFLDLLEQSDLTLRATAARSSLPGSAAEPVHGRSEKTTIRLGAFARLAPLLEDMLGLEAVDNSETALLRGQARADALARLLRDLLLEAAKSAPIVVVMEDMHWLDPTSLSFFADLGASRAPLMLLGATRGPDASPAVRRSSGAGGGRPVAAPGGHDRRGDGVAARANAWRPAGGRGSGRDVPGSNRGKPALRRRTVTNGLRQQASLH